MLEDIFEFIRDQSNLPDGHHDVRHHHHSTGFHLRIPKIYDAWVFVEIKSTKTSLNLEDFPDHRDLPDGY